MADTIAMRLTGTELNEGLQTGSSFLETDNLEGVHHGALGGERLFIFHTGWLTDVVAEFRDHQMSLTVEILSHLIEAGV